jgi:hypothetical protein
LPIHFALSGGTPKLRPLRWQSLPTSKNTTGRTNRFEYGFARPMRGNLSLFRTPALNTNGFDHGSAMLMRGKSLTCRTTRLMTAVYDRQQSLNL